jgi:hypothetical protein
MPTRTPKKKPARAKPQTRRRPRASKATDTTETLTLKLPSRAKRALKVRAAQRGISVARYFLRLARQDGVDVEEPA